VALGHFTRDGTERWQWSWREGHPDETATTTAATDGSTNKNGSGCNGFKLAALASDIMAKRKAKQVHEKKGWCTRGAASSRKEEGEEEEGKEAEEDGKEGERYGLAARRQACKLGGTGDG
jgi:hypothetical protein